MGHETPVVREARPEDAPSIARVHIASWQSAYAHVFPAAALQELGQFEARRAAYWRETLEERQARSHTLVAVSNGDVVGFVYGGPGRDGDVDAKRVGELVAIYVLPDFWRSGAGRSLLAAFLERLRSSGFAEAVLWVLEDNPRARHFYEATGWETDGGLKTDEFLGTAVREVRYRIALGVSGADR